MSKLLVVFGATGQQGGSLVDFVLAEQELSLQFKVRAITRDTTKPAALALKGKGVEVVQADANDKESVKRALQGAHTVFLMTNTLYQHDTKQKEFDLGKTLADLAVEAGAECLIFSSIFHAEKLSGGKLKNVIHFDAKAEVEEYIRGLPIKSAFFAPGSFMQNFHGVLAPRPVAEEDGSFAISNVLRPDTQLPLIDVAADTGKFIGAILAEPDKYAGKVLCAATKLYSMEEIAETMSEITGKRITYKQLPDEVFRGFLPPHFDIEMLEMMQLFRDYGYYGPDQAELVEWTAQQARGKLTTLEEYLTEHPLHLT